MSEVLTVLRREFMERVRSKAFVIGTFLFPVLIFGIYALPLLLGGEKSVRKLVIVDEAPAGVAALAAASLQNDTAGRDGRTYQVEVMRGPLEGVREGLVARVNAKEIDGYVHFPADIVTKSEAAYRARNVANLSVLTDVQRAASQAVQAQRLQTAGLDGRQVAALLRRVELSTARITATGEKGGSAITTFFMAYGVAMLMYMMIFLYAINVMRSVLEEKTSRISEVIVSSMKASHLMMGKIVGVASVALLQVGIWGVILYFGMSALNQRFGAEAGSAMAALRLPAGTMLTLLAFFVLGFLLYAALFAAVGAAVNTEQEAQQFQTWVMLPLIIPVLFFMRVTGDPLGPTATILGLIPFTAPVANAMRLGTAEVPALQVAASLALLAATTVFVAWLAGKIYRIGILSTGQKPTLKDLGRWLKAA
jgi:ABC-2 type transport system permease protein